MYDEKHGRYPNTKSRNPYTCGITGKTYTADQVAKRVDHLSRAIGKRLGFSPAEGTEWDRVVALYSLNTVRFSKRPKALLPLLSAQISLTIFYSTAQIDYIPFTHAVHRLAGIVTPANAQYSALELEHQLRSSSAKAIFTCMPLLENALKAAKTAGIPEDRIFLLEVPGFEASSKFTTVDQLIEEGKKLPAPEPLKWVTGQGGRQTAFLCYSSGTSGLPVRINSSSHLLYT
jgi:acyl-CoA synthetase (AMP-forming)/AMP-acid ligase II